MLIQILQHGPFRDETSIASTRILPPCTCMYFMFVKLCVNESEGVLCSRLTKLEAGHYSKSLCVCFSVHIASRTLHAVQYRCFPNYISII